MKQSPETHLKPEHESFIVEIASKAQILLPEDGIRHKFEIAEKENRRLRVKMGFDPTSPDLHLGHAVSMMQLRRFQDLGHLPVIIIGDFTGQIGDPSGRNESRPLVTADEISRNAETYIQQLSKVLDINDIEVHRNSDWLSNMNLSDVIHMLSQSTLSSVISRDDFRKRLDAESPIGLHEIIYPLLQGTDSVAIDADIELGGVDQLYAFQAGRMLQANKEIDPQSLILMPLLRGTDGAKKMSKSIGNYVALNDTPNDMFGKIMSIPDTLVEEYFSLATPLPKSQIEVLLDDQSKNPMEVKIELAKIITALYHGEDNSSLAKNFFDKQFRKKDQAEYVQVTIDENVSTIVDTIIQLGIAQSKSGARRLITSGAVRVNSEKIDDVNMDCPASNFKLKVGKRNFFEVTQ